MAKNRLQCRRPGFHPWIGKIHWRRKRLSTPVFWPEELHQLYLWGCKELDMTEWLSLTSQMVRNLPAMQKIRVQSLGQKDPPRKGMATHSSILAWRIPWTEETGGLQSLGPHRIRHNWVTHTHTHTHRGIINFYHWFWTTFGRTRLSHLLEQFTFWSLGCKPVDQI